MIAYSVFGSAQIYPFYILLFKDFFSLTKNICLRNFGNEFAFTHSKD